MDFGGQIEKERGTDIRKVGCAHTQGKQTKGKEGVGSFMPTDQENEEGARPGEQQQHAKTDVANAGKKEAVVDKRRWEHCLAMFL